MIKMIVGVYGLRVVSGKDADGNPKYRVKGMGPNDGPFSVDAAEEARLVNLGIAEYVASAPVVEEQNASEYSDAPIGFDETPPEDDGEDAVDEVELEELTAKELREVGMQYGLTFKANASKATMIEAIKAAQSEDDFAEDDGEDAPSFDASEAVL